MLSMVARARTTIGMPFGGEKTLPELKSAVCGNRTPAQPDTAVAWIGAVVGIGTGLITLCGVMPTIRSRILKNERIASE
jgi:hypothetical protein